MMTQENYVNINDLHKQGWTILEIAEATGWHRTTVSNDLKNGGACCPRNDAYQESCGGDDGKRNHDPLLAKQ